MRSIAKLVHLGFRNVERAADWLTGSAGPFFIALCIGLVLTGIWTFFTTMFPQLAQAPPELRDLFRTRSPAHIALGLMPTLYNSSRQTPLSALNFFSCLAVCLFIVWSIGWHYYMACTESPGTVLEGFGDSTRERRTGPGSSIWWARFRRRAAQASGPSTAPAKWPAAALASGKDPLPYEPASPIRVASRENLPAHSTDSQSSLSVPGAAATKMAQLMASSCPPPRKSSSRASSLSLPGRRLSRSPLPVSMQEAELCPPDRRTASPEYDAVFDKDERGASIADDHNDDDEDDDTFPIARMCHKCPRVPLWKALSVLPPELRRVERQLRCKTPSSRTKSQSDAYSADNGDDEGEAEIRAWLGDDEAEKLVPPPKPERSHHCRACKTCTLKYDHHCPWINACVGIGNERYFVLFMTWLAIGCAVVAVSGWKVMRRSIEFRADWPYPYTPRICVLLLYVLAVVMGLALAVMAGWQFVLIARGESSVDSNDNAYYRELARKRGQAFDNVYDVGVIRNLQLFFNVGPGSPYPYYTILLPRRIPPYSDGWHWAKKRGLGGRHAGVRSGEELTDEEVDYDDEATVYRPSLPSSPSARTPSDLPSEP